MTKKDLLEANDRLLKKRKQNQENKDILGQIQLKLKEGEVGIVRKYALQYLNTHYRDRIIEIFKNLHQPTFECLHCKALTPRKFLEPFLAYDYGSSSICDSCKEVVRKDDENKQLQDKEKAIKLFMQQKDSLIDQMLVRFMVPPIFIKARETDLKDNTISKLQKDCKEADRNSINYFITGDVGTGKTHLAVILLRRFLESIRPTYDQKRNICHLSLKDYPIFVTVPELLLAIRECFDLQKPVAFGSYIYKKQPSSETNIIDHYSTTPFLVLDDLGVEKASEWSLQTLYIIINRRYVDSNLITVITSNLSLDDLAIKLNGRITSRIAGMCKSLRLTGNDKRI